MSAQYCHHLGALPADYAVVMIRYCRDCAAWEAWADLVTDDGDVVPVRTHSARVEGGPFDGPSELEECLHQIVHDLVAFPGAPWDR